VRYNLEEILFNYALEINTVELFNDTISILEQLKLLGIPVYLLSNSIFKKNVMKKFINQYDLDKYFVNIHFSADYGIRKPHRDLFEIVFDDIKKHDTTIKWNKLTLLGITLKLIF